MAPGSHEEGHGPLPQGPETTFRRRVERNVEFVKVQDNAGGRPKTHEPGKKVDSEGNSPTVERVGRVLNDERFTVESPHNAHDSRKAANSPAFHHAVNADARSERIEDLIRQAC